jgi:hypothetical protein
LFPIRTKSSAMRQLPLSAVKLPSLGGIPAWTTMLLTHAFSGGIAWLVSQASRDNSQMVPSYYTSLGSQCHPCCERAKRSEGYGSCLGPMHLARWPSAVAPSSSEMN